MFGTSGIRGEIGREVTADLALAVGRAVASEGAGRVVVGSDPRESGAMLTSAVTAGLRECGAGVVELGTASTPTIARAVGWEGADAGVAITASHNPPEDNGIKLWTPSGQAYDEDRRAAVTRRVEERDFSLAAWDGLGRDERATDAAERHVDAIRDAVDVEALTVAVDVGNGAGQVTADALTALGCDVRTLNAQPDGTFPARPSEPTAENCRALCRFVTEVGADLGIAHDGDADRMRAVTETGEFVPGDAQLTLFGREAAEAGQKVAMPVDVSLAVEDVLAESGVEVVRTRVGDVYVAEATSDPDVAFGGEQSGAWIWPDETLCPDGPLAAAKLAELVGRKGPLSALVDGVVSYPIVRDAVTVEDKARVMDGVRERVVDAYDDVSTVDGVRVSLDDGWFLVRASGTEPVVRVQAEAREADRTDELLDEARELVADSRARPA